MMTILKNFWTTVASAFGSPPKRQQVAALCYRGKGARKEVLLITSRGITVDPARVLARFGVNLTHRIWQMARNSAAGRGPFGPR